MVSGEFAFAAFFGFQPYEMMFILLLSYWAQIRQFSRIELQYSSCRVQRHAVSLRRSTLRSRTRHSALSTLHLDSVILTTIHGFLVPFGDLRVHY